MRTAVQETVLGLFVRAIDLEVVFQFALAPQASVERLRMLVIVIAVAFKEAAPLLRQAHRMVSPDAETLRERERHRLEAHVGRTGRAAGSQSTPSGRHCHVGRRGGAHRGRRQRGHDG